MRKWLPPGGHLEENETPAEGVLREVLEETGLKLALMRDEHLWIEEWNATSMPRPYFCLLERVPAIGDQPAHEHMDFIFVGKPLNGTLLSDPNLRWFQLDEILRLESDVDIFLETQKAIQHLLQRAENFVYA